MQAPIFCGERVGVLEVLEDGLLVGHGDGHAPDGDVADDVAEVGDVGGLEREVDGVDGFAAERRCHHDGAKATC